MPNHLAGENSPYLLQHAANPVDWYPWGEEALERAVREDKPIFLSIGYAACHWCHVMAHESFEDAATAALLNEHFISIKVDREERPDLDSIYMQATTAMTGSGGWPMSVFLTPDLKPFYAGTYFPPVRRHNLPAFADLLQGLAQAWRGDRAEVSRVAAQVVESLTLSVGPADTAALSPVTLDRAEKTLVDGADRVHGGWGRAPKFPQPMAVEFLLRRAATRANPDPEPLAVALHALKAMARGGMYDVVGGGFSRYSTDDSWRVPHFEKMLYDNAQLSLAYLHAGLLTQDTSLWRVATETLDFVVREMRHPDGGFYSSLDADSAGVEGKFYVWTKDELMSAIDDEALFEVFAVAYAISAQGNWEGRTVLQAALDDGSLAARFKTKPQEIRRQLAECHTRLLRARSARVRPTTDDKVITAWNGLMLQAFSEAGRFLEDSTRGKQYLEVAMRSARFLLTELSPNGKLRHTWRNGVAGTHVFLEDYAALILGLLDLYQATFQNEWFSSAQALADDMLAHFADPEGGFFDTPDDAEGLLVRPKDLQDGATPSGNALACEALLKLAAFTGDSELRTRAERGLSLVMAHAAEYPTAFSRWLNASDLALAGDRQLALLYPPQAHPQAFLHLVNAAYHPNLLVAASQHPPGTGTPPILADRPLMDGLPTAYLCEHWVCRQPVTDPQKLLLQL